nr:MAG TPA: hypothetical protein [Caudoviricetes sp.]
MFSIHFHLSFTTLCSYNILQNLVSQPLLLLFFVLTKFRCTDYAL